MPTHRHPLRPSARPTRPTIAQWPTRLLRAARLDAAQEARIDRTATRLIEAIRANDDPLGGVEDMLREFALSTKEGLALMVLAEALLRVPDARTADQFIEDKLGQGDFIHHETRSSAFLVNASAWALGMSARVIQPGETPQGTIGRLTKRLGAPAVRAATRQAMRLMGNHFVLGETIEAALSRAQPHSSRHQRYSFDMLGEGARTADDAARYFNSYASAIEAIGRTAGDRPLPDRPGISVKLSALHPRFEAVSRARVMSELVPRLIDLARQAKSHDLNFTVDAEEADRLELSLDVIAAAVGDPSLAGWDGFGLAIQAYQKRACDVIDYVDASRTQPRPQNDGAAGQGRLLGHRDQARAGTRARRLSRVHPQGDDGSELRRLRATIAGAAAADFSAVRHPQCADGRDHPRTGNGPKRIRIPAPARHGRGALRKARRRPPRHRPSHLCAGRQPPRSAGLSGAAIAGERRQFILCRARRRRGGAGIAIAAASGRHHRQCRKCRASQHPVAARSVWSRPEKLPRHRIRRTRGAGATRLDHCRRTNTSGGEHHRRDRDRRPMRR